MERKDYVKMFIACVLCVFLLAFYSFSHNAYANDKKDFGGIKVEVSDCDGNLICGAKVYVCDIGEFFETGKNGQTANISVPILPDPKFIDICKKEFGELTLLVTKEGYCPTCVTGVIARTGVTRLGPKVVLKAGEQNDFQHQHDDIDRSWLKRFCEKYSKK